MSKRALLVGFLAFFCVSCSPKPDNRTPDDLLSTVAAHKIVDEHSVNGLRDLPSVGRVIFAQPSSRFALPLSGMAGSLEFGFGILDGATLVSPPTEGTNFRLLLTDSSGKSSEVWARRLRPTTVPTDRGPQKASINIPNGTKEVIFETLPNGDFRNAWAYWAGLSIK
jgi:hypothetical protein